MNESSGNPAAEKYRVVALRYRPGDFDDLIGQTQVSTALGNAIEQNRVGHAYLFTGARGVGKTSSARIFAKCLNCEQGPSRKPCGQCDICQGVSTGEDVDVLEIDGASNRGIDEIRQLRANANVRPSRARFKIYIIDEVHMLTVAAFNALLKTLEEPPSHVKFIFCTTDPEKIPITVLSRCQRFDFPPIQTQSIVGRLRHIVDTEQIEADDAALELLARRAGGSMRDSQSLLEQLLSYATTKITVAEVHALLGTADNEVVFEIAEAIIAGNAADALACVHRSAAGGVDAGQLAEQLLGLFRDAMACLVGCGDELMLHCSTDDMPRLQQLTASLGVEKTLSVLQVLDQTLVKVRHSTWVRTLLETAVVRCCHLQDIDLVPQLIQQLQSGPVAVSASSSKATPATKKKAVPPAEKLTSPSRRTSPPGLPETASTAPPESASPISPAPVSASPAPAPEAEELPAPTVVDLQKLNPEQTWRDVLAEFNDMTAEAAGNFDSIRWHNERLKITIRTAIDHQMCERPAAKQRLEAALEKATGKAVRIDFLVSEAAEKTTPVRPVRVSRRQLVKQMEQNEFVKMAVEMFDSDIEDVQPPGASK